MLSEQDRRLAQYLTQSGICSHEVIEQALLDWEKRGVGRLSDFLLLSRAISARELLDAQRALRDDNAPPKPRRPRGRHIRGLTQFSFNAQGRGDPTVDDSAPTRRTNLPPVSGPGPIIDDSAPTRRTGLPPVTEAGPADTGSAGGDDLVELGQAEASPASSPADSDASPYADLLASAGDAAPVGPTEGFGAPQESDYDGPPAPDMLVEMQAVLTQLQLATASEGRMLPHERAHAIHLIEQMREMMGELEVLLPR